MENNFEQRLIGILRDIEANVKSGALKESEAYYVYKNMEALTANWCDGIRPSEKKKDRDDMSMQ